MHAPGSRANAGQSQCRQLAKLSTYRIRVTLLPMAQKRAKKGDAMDEPIELDDEPDLDPQIYAIKEQLDKVQGG